jgi:hypothetical protein
VPHPVEYLVAPDGMVIRKYFVPNYQHRVTESSVVLREFGADGGNGAAVTLRSGALTVEIGFSGASAFAGQEIGFYAKFHQDRGHVTAASIAFDHPGIARQSFELPEANPITMVRSTDWVHCCSDFRSKPAVSYCRANFIFNSAATPFARRPRQSRSNCR